MDEREIEKTAEVIIPPGLKKRWEEFGEAARKCWEEAPEEDTLKRMATFWKCMEERAGRETMYGDIPLTKAEAEKCAAMGKPVQPHPICVLAKRAEDRSVEEAVKECLEEGKYHGISALACKLKLEGVT